MRHPYHVSYIVFMLACPQISRALVQSRLLFLGRKTPALSLTTAVCCTPRINEVLTHSGANAFPRLFLSPSGSELLFSWFDGSD